MSPRPSAVYKDCIITFLDLLGFSQLVDGGASAQDIAVILDTLEMATSLDPIEGHLWGERRIAMSDSVLHVAEISPSGNPIGIDFRVLLLGLVHAQMDLVNRGIILRGAIVRGEVFIDEASDHDGDARFFGPGYQAAHKAESEEEFPRIIVAEELVDEIKLGKIGYAQELPDYFHKNLDELLVHDPTGGVYTLDYLYIASFEVADPEAYCDYLAKHRDLIQRRLNEYSSASNVLRKYVWLAEYHNETLKKLDPSRFLDCCKVTLDSLCVSPVPPMPSNPKGGSS
tara:strand:- start:1078 stop:1929 length:852 start_codon:yes stop_codon:yes gene_type:complete